MQDPKVRYDGPTTIAKIKDPNLKPEQMLEVDVAQLAAAKNAELMKPMKIRFIEDGPDRTLDQLTEYKKNVTIDGFSAQQTVMELRERIADDENMPIEDVNVFVPNTPIPSHVKVGDLYVEWQGFGLEDWPPKFIIKPRVRGFEVFVDVAACRDTAVWDGGRLQSYADRHMVYDVETGTTVRELKELISKRIKIPAGRQKLFALMRRTIRSWGDFEELMDNGKTMSDYQVDQYCVRITVEKNPFDENGQYVFDDGYWDEDGYTPPPLESWIPVDSQADRSRPDAHQVDPRQPATMIVSDRWALPDSSGKKDGA